MNPASWSMPLLSGTFLLCAVMIAIFGVRMTRVARDLAHRTGLGELDVLPDLKPREKPAAL